MWIRYSVLMLVACASSRDARIGGEERVESVDDGRIPDGERISADESRILSLHRTGMRVRVETLDGSEVAVAAFPEPGEVNGLDSNSAGTHGVISWLSESGEQQAMVVRYGSREAWDLLGATGSPLCRGSENNVHWFWLASGGSVVVTCVRPEERAVFVVPVRTRSAARVCGACGFAVASSAEDNFFCWDRGEACAETPELRMIDPHRGVQTPLNLDGHLIAIADQLLLADRDVVVDRYRYRNVRWFDPTSGDETFVVDDVPLGSLFLPPSPSGIVAIALYHPDEFRPIGIELFHPTGRRNRALFSCRPSTNGAYLFAEWSPSGAELLLGCKESLVAVRVADAEVRSVPSTVREFEGVPQWSASERRILRHITEDDTTRWLEGLEGTVLPSASWLGWSHSFWSPSCRIEGFPICT